MRKPIIGTGKNISLKEHMSEAAQALSEGFPGGTPGPSNIVSKGFSKYLAEGHSYGLKKSGGPAKPITGALGSETRRAEYDAKGWKYDHTIAGDHEGSYKSKKKEGGASTETGESSVTKNTGEGEKKKETAQKNLDKTKETVKSNQKDRQAGRSAKRKEKRTKRITKREEIRQARQSAKDSGLKGKAKRQAIRAAKKEAKKKQKA